MFVFLMSNSDLFDKLYQEINRQNTFYFWIIGIVLSVSVAIAAFIGILQWRLSSKQIEKIKADTIAKVEDNYHLSNLNDDVSFNANQTEKLKAKIAELEKTIAVQKQILYINGFTAITELDQLASKLRNNDSSTSVDLYYQKMYRLIDEIVTNTFTPNISKASTLSIVYDKLYFASGDSSKKANEVRAYMREKSGDLIKVGQEFMKSPLRNKDNN